MGMGCPLASTSPVQTAGLLHTVLGTLSPVLQLNCAALCVTFHAADTAAAVYVAAAAQAIISLIKSKTGKEPLLHWVFPKQEAVAVCMPDHPSSTLVL